MAKPGFKLRDFISRVCNVESSKEQSVVKEHDMAAQGHGICRRKWSRYCRLSGNQERRGESDKCLLEDPQWFLRAILVKRQCRGDWMITV